MIGIIYLAVAVLLFVIGLFIKVKKVTWLISGYNTASKEEKEKYDIDKLCYYVGNFIIMLAIIWLFISGASFLFPFEVELITIIGVIVQSIVLVIGIIFLNTNNRVKN